MTGRPSDDKRSRLMRPCVPCSVLTVSCHRTLQKMSELRPVPDSRLCLTQRLKNYENISNIAMTSEKSELQKHTSQ